jgi:hypothetical protein|tara:strand:- start:590 stop:769 length:180 start_codon:yes stop_codon:yes gene_type:complete
MTVQDQSIQEVQSKNKAEEFEKKKELRKKIIDFAETGSLHQLTEINSEINRLTKRRVIL